MEYKLAEKSYVTVSDLFEYVEKEVELMEYSKTKRQFNQRRHETNT